MVLVGEGCIVATFVLMMLVGEACIRNGGRTTPSWQSLQAATHDEKNEVLRGGKKRIEQGTV